MHLVCVWLSLRVTRSFTGPTRILRESYISMFLLQSLEVSMLNMKTCNSIFIIILQQCLAFYTTMPNLGSRFLTNLKQLPVRPGIQDMDFRTRSPGYASGSSMIIKLIFALCGSTKTRGYLFYQKVCSGYLSRIFTKRVPSSKSLQE